MKNKAVCATLSVCMALLIISLSIAFPIYFRPFYYMQIDGLGITEETGLTKDDIKDSYDSLLDYLTIPWKGFSTGAFEYSEEGASHFRDCRVLFGINTIVLVLSLTLVAVICVLFRLGKLGLDPIIPARAMLYAGVAVLAIFLSVALLALLDFDGIFELMHVRLFPNKDNWVFDPSTDGIILALPEKFFKRCAIAIATLGLTLSLGAVIASKIIINRKKTRRTPA